jgi:hypothetical protein
MSRKLLPVLLALPLLAALYLVALPGRDATAQVGGTIYLPLALKSARPLGPGEGPTPVPSPTPSAEAGWCERVRGGQPFVPSAASWEDVAIDLAIANSDVRAFAVHPGYDAVDRALAEALAGPAPFAPAGTTALLARYVEDLPAVCAVASDRTQRGIARVDMVGNVAVVVPGVGPVDVPAAAQAVAVDLRGLPNVRELDLRDSLDNAFAAAVAEPVPWPGRWLRRHDGLTDELTPTSPFTNELEVVFDEPFVGAAESDRPLAVITGRRMAPLAAEYAAAMRVAGRAWLIGEDVLSSVAEASWDPVGEAVGLAWRGQELEHRWPAAPPETVTGAEIGANDPNDPGTAGFRYRFALAQPSTGYVVVDLLGQEAADLDLYLLHDADGDGTFRYPDELLASSIETGSRERVRLHHAAAGDYEVWVHGYDVNGTTTFDLTVQLLDAARYPDVIPADTHTADPLTAVADLPGRGTPPPLDMAGGGSRPPLEAVAPFGPLAPSAPDPGEVRAALLIAHGMTDLFYPFFHIVDPDTDGRLLETLLQVPDGGPVDRDLARQLLQRFGQVLADGQQAVLDPADVPAGFLPLVLEPVDGAPVVRRSGVAEVQPGDTITTIDGVPADTWYTRVYSRTSAASPDHLFFRATERLQRLDGPMTLGLRAPDGTAREVTVPPQPAAALAAVGRAASLRPAGPLTDLGAPDIHYINLDAGVLADESAFESAIAMAAGAGAAGLVLDVRGVPVPGAGEFGRHVVTHTLPTALFDHFVYTGAGLSDIRRTGGLLLPRLAPAYEGPLVVLTDGRAYGEAERFMMPLYLLLRGDFVGRPSAATTGTPSGVRLPGGFGFALTAEQPLYPTSPPAIFHTIGIRPDTVVAVTVEDLAAGVDRDLLTAIETLRGP